MKEKFMLIEKEKIRYVPKQMKIIYINYKISNLFN